MKALFVTTDTSDCTNHVRAWDSFNEPAERVTFQIHGINNDWMAVRKAEEIRPDVIFYIGANTGSGQPRIPAFHDLKRIAPIINICSDAADRPWHAILARYRREDCFSLQVALDGSRESPVDLAVLTPIDPLPFAGRPERDIRCGFSGSVARRHPREVVTELESSGDVTIRRREPKGGYESHGHFMTRCEMVLNPSWTGTGQAHHIKGRVLEAGWAGCALLEYVESPINDWLPQDCYLTWSDPKEAAAIIAETTDAEIEHVAGRLAREVRAHFTAKQIYDEMLSRVL